MSSPLIVNFAPTGVVPTRAMSLHAPLSTQEIIDDVHAACEMGITITHLHVRDQHGKPTLDPEIYARLIEKIRAFAPDLVICISLSGRGDWGLKKRLLPLSLDKGLKPDMASLTLGSFNFPRDTSSNTPETIKALATEMLCRGVLPELEVFDLGMVNYVNYLVKKEFIKAPFYFNVIAGNIASLQLDMAHIGTLIRDLPPESHWSLGGIGGAQLGANTLAIAMGGGVRVGLEDNLYLDLGRKKPANNQMLLQRIKALAEMFERPFMTPAQFRQLLKLEAGHGRYGRVVPPMTDTTLKAV